jgi:Ca-activated chloride channel homolog
MLAIIIGMLMIAGCDDSKNPVATSPVTQIVANGSLAPTSRTQAQGTLLIADQSGNAITGLTSQNISVQLTWGSTGNSVVGTVVIQSLAQSGKNIAVATTMDYSGSMYSGNYNTAKSQYQRILDMETGVKTFVNALKTNDICEIIKFDDYIHVVQPFTSSKQTLLHAVDSALYLQGNTALYQSIYTGIQDAAVKSASSYARAVVAFTDGGENASSISLSTLLQTARLNAIPVYTIGLLDSTSHSTPPGLYYPETTLVQIADSTGGFYFYAPNASQLQQIYNIISGQLSNSYTVTITWPSTTLPPAGTLVTAVITVNYNGLISVFQRDFTMP